MAGLVEEIQAQALDPNTSVSDLLRKVKLAAAKLKLEEADAWVDRELKGYPNGKDLPDYRKTSGNVMSHNPYHGPQPLGGDPDTLDHLSRAYITESIGSLETFLDKQGGVLIVKLPQHIIDAINKMNSGPYCEVYNHIPPSTVRSIMDRVRTMILDWAIALERADIIGEGISFTMEEKQKAEKAGASIQITNYGHFHQGDVTGNQNRALVHSSENSTNVLSQDVFEQLTETVSNQIDNAADRDVLLELIKHLESAKGTNSFQGLYQRFMAAAASYMTILGPFVPALTDHLPKLIG